MERVWCGVVVLVAACGGGGDQAPDAAVIDGEPSRDGMVIDGPVDALVDGEPIAIDAAPAALAVSPNFYTFEAVGIGETAFATFSVANLGGSSSGIPTVEVSGNPGFSLKTTTCTAALAAGESCAVRLRFRPQTFGTATGNVVIRTTPGSDASAVVTGQPVFRDYIGVSPQELEIDGVALGTTSAFRTVYVTNASQITTPEIGVTITGPDAGAFTIDHDLCTGLELARFAGCSYDVSFHPTHAGAAAASAVLTPIGWAPVLVDLTGTAPP